MKRIFFILLPVFLALFLSSCSGMAKEMTADEMKAELGEITGTLPDTETTGVNLSQEDTGGYNADLQLTWKNECGRFSTEKTLESYSWAVAQNISQNIADVLQASRRFSCNTRRRTAYLNRSIYRTGLRITPLVRMHLRLRIFHPSVPVQGRAPAWERAQQFPIHISLVTRY